MSAIYAPVWFSIDTTFNGTPRWWLKCRMQKLDHMLCRRLSEHAVSMELHHIVGQGLNTEVSTSIDLLVCRRELHCRVTIWKGQIGAVSQAFLAELLTNFLHAHCNCEIFLDLNMMAPRCSKETYRM